MKVCIVCNKSLPLNEFAQRKDAKDGHRNACLVCENKRKSIHATKNKTMTTARHQRYINANVKSRKATSAISSHRNRGYEILITSAEIKKKMDETVCCPLCGQEIDYSRTPKDIFKMPSVDRINNESYLSIDNTWIICRRCNTAKGNLPLKEFVEYCKRIGQNCR